MRDSRDERDQYQRCKRPTDQELNKRQLENIETYIATKKWITDAERLWISEQQPVLPLCRGRQADQQTQHKWDHDSYQPLTSRN